MRIADAKSSIAEAHQLAQEKTNGQVSVARKDGGVYLQRQGFEMEIGLSPNDLTEPGIEDALSGWEDWPVPQTEPPSLDYLLKRHT